MQRPLTLVFVIFLLFTMKRAFSRTINIPLRKSAVIYYLQITDLLSQESLTLESEVPEIQLPDHLEGTYSIKVSFKDKWGREISGENPKIIHLVSQTPLKNDKEKMVLSQERKPNKILLTPYFASGSAEVNLKANITNKKKFTSPLSGKGLKIFSSIYGTEKWRIGLDVLRASNEESTFNSTELDLGYDWIDYGSASKVFKVSTHGAYAKTESLIESVENLDKTQIASQASTAYLYAKGAAILKFEKITLDFNAILGGSISYLRYSAGSSVVYNIKPKYSLGPSFEYAKFENGTKVETIKANILKVGLNFILNL
jgi:hypothetical protein